MIAKLYKRLVEEAGFTTFRDYMFLELHLLKYEFQIDWDGSDVVLAIRTLNDDGEVSIAHQLYLDPDDFERPEFIQLLENLIVDLEAGRKKPADLTLRDLGISTEYPK